MHPAAFFLGSWGQSRERIWKHKPKLPSTQWMPWIFSFFFSFSAFVSLPNCVMQASVDSLIFQNWHLMALPTQLINASEIAQSCASCVTVACMESSLIWLLMDHSVNNLAVNTSRKVLWSIFSPCHLWLGQSPDFRVQNGFYLNEFPFFVSTDFNNSNFMSLNPHKTPWRVDILPHY